MTLRRVALGLLCVLAATPCAALGFSRVAAGDVLPNEELRTIDGGRAPLFAGDARAHVVVFFRPGQPNSAEALKDLAACQQEFASKPVRFAAIVSSTWPADEVKRTVAASGIRMPVLVDEDDRLYGRLGVRMHPVVGVADEQQRLVGYEPFKRLGFCDRLRAQVRFALREIDREGLEKEQAPRAVMPSATEGASANRHLRLGQRFLEGKQFDKAAGEAREILEKEPGFVPAHLLLGDALAGAGRCDEASRAYAAARQLDPRSEAAAKGSAGCPRK
jgi:hypothetical protein